MTNQLKINKIYYSNYKRLNMKKYNIQSRYNEREFKNDNSDNSDFMSCSDCSDSQQFSSNRCCNSSSCPDSTSNSSNSSDSNNNSSIFSSINKESELPISQQNKLNNDIDFINKTMADIESKKQLFDDYGIKNNKQLSRIKKKTIVMEDENDRKFDEECERFLSYDSMERVICKFRCCKFNCLKEQISPEYKKGNKSESYLFVQTIRTELLARTKEERASKIYELLKGFFCFSLFNYIPIIYY